MVTDFLGQSVDVSPIVRTAEAAPVVSVDPSEVVGLGPKSQRTLVYDEGAGIWIETPTAAKDRYLEARREEIAAAAATGDISPEEAEEIFAAEQARFKPMSRMPEWLIPAGLVAAAWGLLA